jgi:hypothetical protein
MARLTDFHRQQSSKRAACYFEPAKDVKDVVVSDDGRKLRIGTTLDPK